MIAPGRANAEVRAAHRKGRLLLGLSLAAGLLCAGGIGGWWGSGPEAGVPRLAGDAASGAAQPHPRSGLVATAQNRGQVLFGRYCDSCHASGRQTPQGNTLRSAQSKRDFATATRITDKVRKGGFDMPAFTRDSLADEDLQAIAD